MSNSSQQPIALEHVAPLSLRLNFLWSLTALTIYNACQFGLIILLTRLGNPKMVGTFVLAMAACAPFQLIGSQLQSILATDVNHEFSLNNYLRLSLAGALLIILGAALTAMVLKYDTEIMTIILIVAVAKAIENVSYVFYGIMQMYERMDQSAISWILKGLLALAAFWWLLRGGQDLLPPLLGLIAVGVLVLLSYDIPCGLKLSRRGQMKRGRKVAFRDMAILVQKTAPLSVTALLINLSFTVPRFFLERYNSLQALGYFGPIAYVLTASDLAAAALGRSTAPRLARHWFSDRSAFRPIVTKILSLVLVLSLASLFLAYAFGGSLVVFLFGPGYAPYASVFFWLTLAAGFNVFGQFFSYLLTAMRLLNCQAVLSLITMALTIVFCYILIPPYGLWGTSWAIGLAMCFRCVASYFIYYKAIFRSVP